MVDKVFNDYLDVTALLGIENFNTGNQPYIIMGWVFVEAGPTSERPSWLRSTEPNPYRGFSNDGKYDAAMIAPHTEDDSSVAFCNEIGLNYVSASPFRVPVARLAAAQSALGQLSWE